MCAVVFVLSLISKLIDKPRIYCSLKQKSDMMQTCFKGNSWHNFRIPNAPYSLRVRIKIRVRVIGLGIRVSVRVRVVQRVF